MAEEVKKIITVEVGKSITSVRDFKKHLDDLRGSLLGLNEESEEYKTIAEQIATDQAKLNDVMKIGKTSTDSAAGSYVELNNQLKALRNQYKALSETERNSASGQAILQNITKLDTQLKDIDESMGIYNRNVGNYKQAFEEAFKAMAQNIGNVNPQLGKLMQTASSLIPLIKAASNAATTGLKGIKAGLASTGIGLLVVALGEITAHWEQISNWATRVLGIQRNITSETRDTADAAKTYADQLERASRVDKNIQNIWGLSDFEKAESDLNDMSNQISELTLGINSLAIARNELNYLSQASQKDLKQIGKGYLDLAVLQQKALRQIDFYLKDEGGKEIRENINKLTENLDITDVKLKELRKRVLSNDRDFIVDAAKNLDSLFKAVQEDLTKNQTTLNNNYKKLKDTYDEQDKYEKERAKKRAEDLKNVNKTELELLIEWHEQQVYWLTRNLKDEPSGVLEEALKNLEEEYKQKAKALRNNFKGVDNADKERAKELLKSLEDYGKDELEILDKNYVEQLVLLEKFNYDTTNLTKKWQDDRENLVKENYQKEQEELKEQEEAKLQIKREALQKALDLQSNTEFLDTSAAETMWTVNTKTHETDETLEYQKQDRLYEIAEQGYKDRIELYHQYLASLEEGTDEYLDISREMHEEEMGLAKLQFDYQVELEDRLLEKKRKNLQIMQGMFQAYGELGSTVAGLIADASEEGTARWKAARITETVINTISGAAGAFMQGMSSYPQPWGAIIGAAGAAVATATGAAQIAKIKSTQIGTSSVSGIAANSSGVGVEPLLNPDYDLQRLTNLSLQSDAYLPGNTQVYVLESDIQEVGNRVQVRENNATF